ncbi:MAG: DUF4105 domain-containing protein [Pseudomonadota bacterium]
MSRAAAARAIGLAVLAAFALFISVVLAKSPRLDRDWRTELAVLPQVSWTGETATVSGVRDWRYGPQGPRDQRYFETQMELDALARVWFVMEPFRDSEAIGHTFVLFEFDDGRLMGLTIEARKEMGEPYSPLKGVFNAYELHHVWATARDLLTRRAVFLEHKLYVYPLELTDVQRKAYLQRLLETSAALAREPRFYNTLVSNCTNELAKVADLDWHYAFILTGYAARALHDRGLISNAAAFEETRDRAELTAEIATLNALPPSDFDRALLRELRKRWDAAS